MNTDWADLRGSDKDQIRENPSNPCSSVFYSSRLYLLRHNERVAIRSAEQLISRFILTESFRRGVEGQAAADAVGDVAQMTKASAFVPFLDVGVGPLVGANAVEEVAQVRLLERRRLVRRRNDIAGLLALFLDVVDVPALAVEDERALLAVQDDAGPFFA